MNGLGPRAFKGLGCEGFRDFRVYGFKGLGNRVQGLWFQGSGFRGCQVYGLLGVCVCRISRFKF